MNAEAIDFVTIKVGGSLLDLPDLGRRIASLIERENLDSPLLIVGGGGFVDELRRLDRLHCLSELVADDLALQAMSLSAALLASLHPSFELVRQFEEANQVVKTGNIPVLQCDGIAAIQDLEPSWDVTSDSIAAVVASRTKSKRLILLKSVDLPDPPPTFNTAAEMGLVDAAFATHATTLFRIDWCPMRADQPTIAHWKQQSEAGGCGQIQSFDSIRDPGFS